MKQTGKQLAHEIERRCRGELDKIEQVGVPREAVIFMAISAAERRFDYFSPDIKKAFRDRATDAKEKAAGLDTQAKKLRAFVASVAVAGQAESLRQYSAKLGEYLREHGRADHDQALPIIVESILSYSPRFDCWKELASVLRVAYIVSGRVTDADDIQADTLHRALLRAATSFMAKGKTKPYRQEVTP